MEKLKQILFYLSSLIGLKNIKWKIKPIPNKSLLYRRVYFGYVKEDVQGNNKFIPNPSDFSAFELSCDWNRYSTPQQSFDLISREYKSRHNNLKPPQFKNANEFFIASILVQDIFDNNLEQEIIHNPLQYFPETIGKPNNRAHSLVKGEKDSETDANQIRIRFWLSKLANWEIFDENRLMELRTKRGQKRN